MELSDAPVQLSVRTMADLGRIAQAVRIAQRLRANEFHLNHQTVHAVESGRDTMQVAKVLEYLHELGIRVGLELPPGLTVDQLDMTRKRIPKATL